jgi:peptidoglycan DL-endopeptidase CwlO
MEATPSRAAAAALNPAEASMFTRIRHPRTGPGRSALIRAGLLAVAVLLLVTAVSHGITALTGPALAADPTAVRGIVAQLDPPRVVTPPVSLHQPTPQRTPAPARATTSVRLHRGDTLWAWSHRCHTPVANLQKLNGLGHSTLIYAGEHLRLPATCQHPGTRRSAAGKNTTSNGHHATTDHTTANTARAVAAVIAYARAQLGKPYRWGAAGPNAFDCSGLTMRAWAVAGVKLPHHAADQTHTGTHVTRAALVPGDLVISNNYGHVQLYIGHRKVIQAPHAGARVQIGPLPPARHVNAYIHLTPHLHGS